jgi:hypothetical protein
MQVPWEGNSWLSLSRNILHFMEPKDSLKCLHEGRKVLHYNVCIGTDSKNMNFLIYITNVSVWTLVLRLWFIKCNTKLSSFSMNYWHEPRLAGVDSSIWKTTTYECTKGGYTNCKRHRGKGSGINILKIKRNLLYIRNQSVPRCKHFPPRLQKPIS